ncbi:MBG domain-containing protein, partial [Parvibaculum sp.]|uniref:MBG domain-containing protein n=1 Tax=Parvibaculum sp. TaxID=2024848 RepID=UPI00320EE954
SGAAASANAGSYAISASNAAGTGLSNYTINYVDGTFSVGKAALTVTAENQSKTYGDAFTFDGTEYTVSGLKNSDAVTSATLTSSGAAATAGVAGSPYAIVASNAAGTGLSNYTVNYVDGTFSVGQRAITVTADDKSKTYGDVNPALTWQVTSGNLVNGDTLTGDLTTAALQFSNVGSYDITKGTLADASGNYAITYAKGSLTVGQRAITVTADAKSKTYGDVNPALTWQVTSGNLVNGDTLTGGLATTALQYSDVGSYGITQGTLADASGNYALSYVGDNLTVGQRAITVTADNVSKLLGSFDPALTYSIASGNLVNGDTFSGILARDAGELPGDYAITQGTLALSSNYVLTFNDGVFTVNPLTQTPGTTTEGGNAPQSGSTVTTGGGGNGGGNGGDVTGSIVANGCREDEKIDKVCVRRPYPNNWQPNDGIRFIPASF